MHTSDLHQLLRTLEEMYSHYAAHIPNSYRKLFLHHLRWRIGQVKKTISELEGIL